MTDKMPMVASTCYRQTSHACLYYCTRVLN